ncbi:Abhydrolase-4 domain-containing protein [Mycena venus]|uniref:Abhydrolase-4 domain-containing protein n=1 Tax=Mycena venus TaxID=2733690 RepID=A0A8H7CB94_9AGAR|nr:Abhydrolase-4 domain-containing protein [Mycena venus]
MVGQLSRALTLGLSLSVVIWIFFSKASPYAKFRGAHYHYESSTLVRAQDEFSWGKIVPSEELIWTDCYSDNQCARLKVPLDYSHPEGISAAIAMVRIHSKVPHDSPSYRGPILVNPGGPGGSGVDLVLGTGAQLSTIVGPEFDIIGFDPRGIARSTPRVSFFESRAERVLWSGDGGTLRLSMNASDDALARAWARAVVHGQLAGERDDGSLRFINTDHTARDMLQIVRAHSKEKLQYWGFSYGSVLGATFAAMFPDNVERLVIDGVVDSENYYATEWSNNLLDTDNAWMAFVHGCVAAGPEECPFFAPTAAEILDKVDKIYASVRARPIPVRANDSFGLVDYSLVREKIFRSLYSPYSQFPVLAQALADLAVGNGTTLFKMLKNLRSIVLVTRRSTNLTPLRKQHMLWLAMMASAFLETMRQSWRTTRKCSRRRNGLIYGSLFICLALHRAWPEFPKTNFQGPFVANTSHPILLVGNTADPVTSLWAAKKMSKGFAGSVVLTQDSVGHCSLSGPSICTQKYIRRYFINGTLPEPDTLCPVVSTPFPTAVGDLHGATDTQAVLSLSAEDRNLLEAVRELVMNFDIRFPAGV